jgi:hypothetical protein
MHRLMTRRLGLALLLFSICAFAQENRVVRVGVATMQNRATRSVPGNIERDRLVAALNQEKPDKKLHIKVQGVPLEGTTPDDVGDEAKQRNCDYVVYTTLVELQGLSDPTMRQPGTVQTNPGGVWSNPNNSRGQALDPEFRATVEYKLYRTGNPTAISGAPYSNQDTMSEIDAVSRVMNQIANRVFAEVKKAGPTMQE